MSLVTVENIENSTEELILAGMISNTSYLSWLEPRHKERYIRNDQVRLLTGIVMEYYEHNRKAPEEGMRELYESMVEYMDEEDAAITKNILKSIGNKYGGREVAFEILTESTHDYYELRSVEILSDTMSGLVQRGRVDEAIEKIDEWYKDPKGVQVEAISLYDESFADAVLDTQTPIFRFNNDLDRFFPTQAKNKFYTFLGGTKSGKSQWLGSLAVEFLFSGLKVVVWEYELQQTEFMHRLLCATTGKGIDQRSPDRQIVSTLSTFDCRKNQNHSCENPERPDNDPELVDFSEYEEDIWIPCTVCRGTNAFEPVVWKQPFMKNMITSSGQLRKEMKMWERQTGDNLRFFNHDPDTQNVTGLKAELERLRLIENFIPDVIIIDSADNLVPSRKYSDKRHELNNIWTELSGLAKHGYLLWTASQTNRTGWNKEWIDTGMVGEDASKLMIADGTVTINQWKTPEYDEYYWNVQRLRAAYYRGEPLPHFDCKVIHDFSRYIACLDCSTYTE